MSNAYKGCIAVSLCTYCRPMVLSNLIHLIHKWRNARKSLGRVHESKASEASASNQNKEVVFDNS